MRKILLLGALAAATLLSACNTIDGIGRDISGGAARVGSYMN